MDANITGFFVDGKNGKPLIYGIHTYGSVMGYGWDISKVQGAKATYIWRAEKSK